MKIIIFTSNGIRHKFVANTLTKNTDEALVISECKVSFLEDNKEDNESQAIKEHFKLQYKTEKNFFVNNDFFITRTLPLLKKEVNSYYIYEVVKRYNPDLMFVFGISSIIKEPFLSMLLPGKFINLHLGLSPYYRGAGTNFWPFINKELEYLGSTILHLDAGIDTGDIICHVRPAIEAGDNVHTVGCKIIKSSVDHLVRIMKLVKDGKKLNRIKQWAVPNSRYYRKMDFNKDTLLAYKNNLRKGIIKEYLSKPEPKIKIISL